MGRGELDEEESGKVGAPSSRSTAAGLHWKRYDATLTLVCACACVFFSIVLDSCCFLFWLFSLFVQWSPKKPKDRLRLIISGRVWGLVEGR